MSRTTICILAFIAVAWSARPAAAQYGQLPTYSNSYSNKVQAYKRPSVNPRLNTYNKYFYHNPAISPYSNLMRPSGQYTSNYYKYVKPELSRRSQVGNPPPRSFGTSGTLSPSIRPSTIHTSTIRTSTPRTTSSYYGHYYGGRQRLGLK